MHQSELIPNLFRTEYRKITAVLCKQFGMADIELAEDIASDTFLKASETWSLKGIPENPVGWLYTVAKNKAKDHFKRSDIFAKKIAGDLKYAAAHSEETLIDLSEKNIKDSQLQMLFAVCHPSISVSAQIGLALRILCGFGIDEIARAFLSNKETINKRLQRAKETLREEKVTIELPSPSAINERLQIVARTLYLLYNEGYYSSGNDLTLRKDLCLEAMRLTHLLIENESTDTPFLNALLSLMCFHSSRFDARINASGETVLYEDQDENLWNMELIEQGIYYLNAASKGNDISKYHLEAAIAYWHTRKEDSAEKWETVLQLYNRLLQIEYSPVAALNRTFALSKANGKQEAIKAAEKLNLQQNHLYHSLLGTLYKGLDDQKALEHFQAAMTLTDSQTEQSVISKNIALLSSR